MSAAWRAALAGALVLATASGAAAQQVDAKKIAPRRQAIIYVDPSLGPIDDYFTHPRILEETAFLEARGYAVTTVAATQRGVGDDLVRNILGAQPPVGAMAFFGHGGEDKGGVLVPTFAGRTADEWRSTVQTRLFGEYQRRGIVAAEADRRSREGARNFGLEMVRNFSCNSSVDPSLAHGFVRPGGTYWGARTYFTPSRMTDRIARCFSPFSTSELVAYRVPLDVGRRPDDVVEPPTPGRTARIHVTAGTYGQNCGLPRGNVTNPLALHCNGRTRCDYAIDHRLIGDPAVGCRKTYVAEWRCGDRPDVHRATAEPEASGRRLTLACVATTGRGRVTVEIQNVALAESSDEYRRWTFERVFTEHDGVGVTFSDWETWLSTTDGELVKHNTGTGRLRIEAGQTVQRPDGVWVRRPDRGSQALHVQMRWVYHGRDDNGNPIELEFFFRQ